jgi:hypothetical protein
VSDAEGAGEQPAPSARIELKHVSHTCGEFLEFGKPRFLHSDDQRNGAWPGYSLFFVAESVFVTEGGYEPCACGAPMYVGTLGCTVRN